MGVDADECSAHMSVQRPADFIDEPLERSEICKLMFSGAISLPQRGRGTAVAVDEEVALLWDFRL